MVLAGEKDVAYEAVAGDEVGCSGEVVLLFCAVSECSMGVLLLILRLPEPGDGRRDEMRR